jgi:signal peptidase I
VEADVADDLVYGPIEIPPSKRRMRRRPSRLRSAIEWVVVVVASLTFALLIQAFVFQPFRIPSLSMYPSLHVGDRIVVNKLSYRVHDVNRGDVVVFTRPDCKQEGEPAWAHCELLANLDDLVKRVVGVPGDRIYIEDSKVFVNGRELEEPYVRPGTKTVAQPPFGCEFPGTKTHPFVVPEKMVFVMGDNRTDSIDGRCFGPIGKDTIVGRAFVKIWPFDRLGWL